MDLYRSKHSDKKYPNSNSSSNDRPSRSFRNSRDNDREDTTVTCADCGDQCTIPFVPKTDRPVYCSDCFRKNKPDDSSRDRPSRDDRGSRYSRDDRGSRYSRDDRGSRYSRDDRGSRNSRDNDREDTTVTCADCGDECTVPFVPRSNKPVYCSDCFRQYKPDDSSRDRPSRDDRGSRYSRDDRGSRYSRDDRGSRYSRDDRGSRNSRDNDREDTTVTCADCGDECTVPFVPRSNKPVYCSDCFRQYKPDDSSRDRPSRDDRGSRYSRDDRGSRYSRDDRGSRYSRDDRGSRNSRDNDREDTTVTCADCGDECTVPFVPRSNKPVYCSDCFRQYKPDDSSRDRPSRDDRGSRNSRDNDREDTTVTCADCGDQCTVPFVPRSNKPVYCSDCFRQYISQMILVETDRQETIEVQDIQETIEVQDIQETILDQVEEKAINS